MRFTTAAVAIAILAAQSTLSAPVVPPLGNGASPTPTTIHSFPGGIGPVEPIWKHPFNNHPIIFAREMHDLMQREDFAGFARELEDLLARDDLDGSEAFGIPSILKTIVKGIPHLLPILGGGGGSQPQPEPSQTAAPAQRRDIQELEARLSRSQLERIFANNAPIQPLTSVRLKSPNEQRSTTDDESGALAVKNILKTIFHIAPIVTTFLPSHESAPQPSESAAPAQRRDLQGSGALFDPFNSVPFIPKVLPPTQIFKQHTGAEHAIARELNNDFFRLRKGVPARPNRPTNLGHGPVQLPHPLPFAQRELVELIARQMDNDDSGAFSVNKIVQTVKKIFNGKTLENAANGASIVSSAVDVGSHLGSGPNSAPPPPPSQSAAPAPQTRDFMEVFARALEARELDELD